METILVTDLIDVKSYNIGTIGHLRKNMLELYKEKKRTQKYEKNIP